MKSLIFCYKNFKSFQIVFRSTKAIEGNKIRVEQTKWSNKQSFEKRWSRPLKKVETFRILVEKLEAHLNWVEQSRNFFLGRENQNIPKFGREIRDITIHSGLPQSSLGARF